jgi:hypothetical protein
MANGTNTALKMPLVFIASSSEGNEVAHAISQNLEGSCECEIWSDGMFEPGNYYLETLINKLLEVDFAVMIMTNDDKIVFRGSGYNMPRDNVLLELGMYMGQLGRYRTFVVFDKCANLKMPSDLDGLTMTSFTPPDRASWRNATSSAGIIIKKRIRELGLKDAQAPISKEGKNCFPKDIEPFEDVGDVLQNHVLPIVKKLKSEGKKIEVKNFGLDLETVMPWLNIRINSGEFAGINAAFKCLIINPESPCINGLIDKGSNVSSNIVNSSINSAREIENNNELNNFELELKQYDLPPIIHGFLINDIHLFLGFTEIISGKLKGGAKPYLYLNKQEHTSSLIALHYYSCFKSWFDHYWSISKTIVNVKK